MNKATLLVCAVLVSIVMAAISREAEAASFTITWNNKLAQVAWNNLDAYCDISVDWIPIVGSTVTYSSTPSLKAYPYPDNIRSQTVTGINCKTLRLKALCHEKTSAANSGQDTRNYTRDVTPCVSTPSYIKPYNTGIVLMDNGGNQPGN